MGAPERFARRFPPSPVCRIASMKITDNTHGQPVPPPAGQAEKRLAFFVAAICAALLCAQVFLLLGAGLFWDEVEFLHAGWLIGHGKTIFRDFFEHHNPVYLYLLAGLYKLCRGFSELAFVYAARVLSLLLFFGAMAAGWRAARKSGSALEAAVYAFCFLVLFSFPSVFLIRMESAGVFFVACALIFLRRIVETEQAPLKNYAIMLLMLCGAWVFAVRSALVALALAVLGFYELQRRGFARQALAVVLCAAIAALLGVSFPAGPAEFFRWVVFYSLNNSAPQVSPWTTIVGTQGILLVLLAGWSATAIILSSPAADRFRLYAALVFFVSWVHIPFEVTPFAQTLCFVFLFSAVLIPGFVSVWYKRPGPAKGFKGFLARGSGAVDACFSQADALGGHCVFSPGGHLGKPFPATQYFFALFGFHGAEPVPGTARREGVSGCGVSSYMPR